MLRIEGLTAGYSAIPVLNGVSIKVDEGQFVAIVGPNGAGKTTLFSTIAGALKPDEGEIRLSGERIDGLRPDEICRRGVARTFQIVRPFPALTVEENIMLPLWVAKHLDRKARLDFVYEVIGELTEMRQRKALLLSGGQQKLVALGRALAIGTKCLLLDEPFEGIAPALSERLSEVLASLKGKDLTLLMSQSDLNHSRGLIDVEFTIERGANPVTAGQ